MSFKHIREKLHNTRPRFIPSFIVALVFCAATFCLFYFEVGGVAATIAKYVLLGFSVAAGIIASIAGYRLWKTKVIQRFCLEIAQKNRYTAIIANDTDARVLVTSFFSTVWKLFIVSAKILIGLYFSSYWFTLLAIYDIVLFISRAVLIAYGRKAVSEGDPKNRYLKSLGVYRLSGIFIFLIALVLLFVVLMIVRDGEGFTYKGILIYIVALYDLFRLVRAIMYIMRTRKRMSPIVNAIRYFGLSSSVISLLSLQTACLAAFGGALSVMEKQQLNMATGIISCGLLLFVSVLIIIKSWRHVKYSKGDGRVPSPNLDAILKEEMDDRVTEADLDVKAVKESSDNLPPDDKSSGDENTEQLSIL